MNKSSSKKNKSITIRISEELLEKVYKEYNPQGVFSLSNTIRLALMGFQPPLVVVTAEVK